ncbi:MAG: hypothetical protein JNK45_06570 [Myxococcales bacterium]|nr:hypothetical protein [Myxococcales bacterium]
MHRIPWPLFVVLSIACDSAEGDDGAPAGDSSDSADPSDCAPADDPAELTIVDVAPAPGAMVPNVDIVHRFVIADSPGLFTSLQLVLAAEHGAGTLDPPAPMFTIVPRGDDLEYSLPPLRWTNVGHVEATFGGGFVDEDDCHWVFPPGIFSYDLQEP